MPLPRLLLTAGEPAGIGSEILLKMASRDFPSDVLVVGDPDLLKDTAASLHLPVRTEIVTETAKRVPHQAGVLRVLPISLRAPVTLGTLNAENAPYVLDVLHTANQLVMQESNAAMVTAPVHKHILSSASFHFQGHTEFLRDACGVAKTIMLFVAPSFKVALFTTHLPLKDVPEHIQADALKETILLLYDELRTRFHIAKPRIAICGLNPHAGESGLLGREELDVIQPVIDELNQSGLQLRGALPADTAFTPHRLSECDAILGMYHDQVLPVVKHIGFGSCVNVTLGLPYIRTSVDHGTALDIAGQGVADEQGLCSAMTCALDLLTLQHRHG